MTRLEISALALALAIDAFSVAASVGPRCSRRWGAVRLAGSFGLFQALMPLLGALSGDYLLPYVRAYDHWVAFGLLALIGLRMLAASVWPGKGEGAEGGPGSFDPSRGWSLLSLSVATSIDAFGAGVGLRLLGADLWFACPLIGVVAAALTYVGAAAGRRSRKYLGRAAEAIGGLVLIGLGVKMLQL